MTKSISTWFSRQQQLQAFNNKPKRNFIEHFKTKQISSFSQLYLNTAKMPSFRAMLVSALVASLSTAHVVLENPKPYKFVADGATNPLSTTGSDFPCKTPPGQSYIVDGEPTSMTIGEDQKLSFSGHAVHGGGSCQLALSRGHPTKDSPWMVIHSIEGGCPARNQKGNLEGPNQDTYKFQIPEGIEPGTNWTLAWTWVSRGGSPEFYSQLPFSLYPLPSFSYLSFLHIPIQPNFLQ